MPQERNGTRDLMRLIYLNITELMLLIFYKNYVSEGDTSETARWRGKCQEEKKIVCNF